MKSFYLGLIFAIGTGLIATGCEPIKKEPEVTGNSPLTNSSNGESSASKGAGEASNSVSKAAISPAELENRKVQFEQMQKSLHAVAGIETSKKGPEFDYKFVLPSDDWEKTSHAGGDRKSSVW